MSDFERIVRRDRAKLPRKARTGKGIKAIITVGDLQSVVAAAKKWQAKCVEDGVDASKLLHHIANAEAVLLKYRTRNKLAFEERERHRAKVAEEAGEPLPPHEPETPASEPRFGTKVWDALNALVGKKADAPVPSAAIGKERARPTRW